MIEIRFQYIHNSAKNVFYHDRLIIFILVNLLASRDDRWAHLFHKQYSVLFLQPLSTRLMSLYPVSINSKQLLPMETIKPTEERHIRNSIYFP